MTFSWQLNALNLWIKTRSFRFWFSPRDLRNLHTVLICLFATTNTTMMYKVLKYVMKMIHNAKDVWLSLSRISFLINLYLWRAAVKCDGDMFLTGWCVQYIFLCIYRTTRSPESAEIFVSSALLKYSTALFHLALFLICLLIYLYWIFWVPSVLFFYVDAV